MEATPQPSQAPHFVDRWDAGRQLAAHLSGLRSLNPIVVGMAPDGMPVAAEVAAVLGCALEAVAVQPLKLGGHEPERFGAAAEGGITFFDRNRVGAVEAQPEAADAAIIDAQIGLEQHVRAWHGTGGRPSLARRAVLLISDALVDEELAAAAACEVRDRGAKHVTFAAPLVRSSAASALVDWVDEILCLQTVDEDFTPAGLFDERSLTDEEIHELLEQNALRRRRGSRLGTQDV